MSALHTLVLPVASLVALALLAAVLVAWLLASRRRSREIAELVSVIERLRDGRFEGPEGVAPESSLAVVAESVRRLSHSLARRDAAADEVAARLRALMDTAPDTALLVTDADGTITEFNEAAERLLGWSADEVAGKPAAVLFGEPDWKDLLAKLARRSVRQLGLATDTVLRRHDGGTIPVRMHVRPLRDEAGVSRGFLAALRDASERVELQRRLDAAELRLRAVLDALPQAAAWVRGGRVAYANPALARVVGLEPATLLDVSFTDWVATRDVLTVRDRLDAVERGDAQAAMVRFAPAGGGLVAARIFRAEVEGGPAAVVLLDDDTADARLADELSRSEQRLDAALEAMSDGVLIVEDRADDSFVRFVNGAFLDRFGLSGSDVLGTTEDDLLRRLRERGGGAEEVAAFLAASRGAALRDTVTLARDEPGDLDLFATPLCDRRGDVIGRVAWLRSASEGGDGRAGLHGRAEALESASRRIDEANAALEIRAREIERAHRERVRLDEMKSQLLANVAHELQTPLVSIRGYTEMILRGRLGPVTDEQRKGLDLSLRNVDRLIGMIDGLLEFARMEREVGEMRPTAFRFADLLEECARVLAPRVDEKGLKWTARVEDPELVVHADREKIQQVLLNVLGNAVKFNRDGGAIEVDVRRRPDGFAVVKVRDTGIGIAKDDVDRIFDRFYRSPETPEGEPGTGLGLSIARNLLRLHGCTIRADSELGRGSTFTFTLPLDDGDSATDEEPEAIARPADVDRTADDPSSERPRLRIIRPANR